MSKLIPEGVTHYHVRYDPAHAVSIFVKFYDHPDTVGSKPISELASEFEIEKAIQPMREKPLSERIVNAADILEQGASHIRNRAVERDQPNGERTMKQIVNAFNALYHTALTEVQGWQFMALLKMARASNGEHNADDYEDQAAYSALAGEAAAKSISERV